MDSEGGLEECFVVSMIRIGTELEVYLHWLLKSRYKLTWEYM